MDGSPKIVKFTVYENIYFKISLGILALSVITFGLGMFFANQVEASPQALILFTVFFLYYHVAHVTYGIGSLIYYVLKIKNKVKNVKIIKTVVSILMSPISFVLFYAASILLIMTQCASA